jgi:hypothetical protein
MTSPLDLLLVPIITAELACDSATAYQWAQAMEERLLYHCQLGYVETMGELERFVLDFLSDYASPSD